ncbi:MAG TPA: glycosyltransferase family 4 protein [Opitutaceae bacterium]|nr:glycosyltransferase family 4 protein [Opitutaceae bacterium]
MVSVAPKQPVYIITHEFHPRRGGIATFTEEIAKATAGLGYQTEVWAPHGGNEPEKPWPFPIRRLALKGTHDIGCQMRLARHLVANRRTLRKSTVYLPEPGPMLAMMTLQFFKALRPKRLLLTFHGSEILRFAETGARRCLARALINRADRVSTLTNYTRRLLCTHFPEATEKTLITPGALRSDFADAKPRRTACSDKVVILTVGRLHPRKGQMFILEALKALPAHLRQRVEYWMVGTGRREGYELLLRETAENSGVTARFFGDVNDDQLDELYDQADIFAMTSINHESSVEGFGLVYLEASAHGLPVVAHAVGGVPEAVVDGVTGLLVPPVNLPALTAAFQRLVTDRELRHSLGTNGQEWARRNCWERSASVLLSNPGAFI